MRVRTLPIIKNKESALRMEVKRCKTEAADLEAVSYTHLDVYKRQKKGRMADALALGGDAGRDKLR